MSSNKRTGRWHRIAASIKHVLINPYTISYIAITILLYIMMVIIYRSENTLGMKTPFDAFWFFCVTFIAGYFDYSPQSVPGRITSLVLLFLGVMLFSAITGKIASDILDIQMKKDKGLVKMDKMKGHFIICGWKPDFEKILDGILDANPYLTPDKILLINEAPSETITQLKSITRFKAINFVSGDYTDEATLDRANIKSASRALIIADHSTKFSQLETDSRTVLAVLTMTNMNPHLYVAAELIDSKFQKHLEMAHCDEIILTTDYEHSLIASASSGLGFSNVLRELIGNNVDSGILIKDIAPSFIGKTYKEYRASLKTDAVLIGLLKNTGNFHQRRKDALREAQKNPDINTIVNNLKKVKTLKSNEPLLTPSDDYIIPPNTKAIFVKGVKSNETPNEKEEEAV
jgi:voltage-gated potassium channel